ncbi:MULTISPECIES: H-NS family nucleoid-associated regulatory protein [Pseudomonadota]|uniref:DNA-binding protein H-NS-like C-terminal domain-containing protein n=1 Tax=Lysobacter enzymogenes TaxID=69 RepID=A0AAU9ASG2_LYSEN|nr:MULTISPECIES: H-NS family nucleoid-associated regulatory protein [Pseudomonadota]BAV99423.1 conserved hypothetical protein [Lysobacter enzymogenes]
MPRTTLQSIDAEIKQLEAQKKLIEKRDGEVPKAIEVLQRYAKVLSAVQRRKVARIIGEVVDVAKPAKAARAKKQGRKLGPVAPKYQLPTGQTWSGRGRTPVAFAAWEKGAEGKAWRKANGDAKFPAASGASASPAKKAAGGKGSKGRKAVKKTRRPAKAA